VEDKIFRKQWQQALFEISVLDICLYISLTGDSNKLTNQLQQFYKFIT
jgi:hypothetical protein